MAETLARNWWALALRGLVAMVFGVAAWIWPNLTLIALVILFGAYAIVDGAFSIAAAVLGEGREPRWIILVMGIAGILIGVAAIVWPGLTAIALVYLIAVWSVTLGALAILAAIALRREIEDEWILAFVGVISILFGVAIAVFPGAGAIALVWLIGTFAIVLGLLLLALAFRLRTWSHRGEDTLRRVDHTEGASVI